MQKQQKAFIFSLKNNDGLNPFQALPHEHAVILGNKMPGNIFYLKDWKDAKSSTKLYIFFKK